MKRTLVLAAAALALLGAGVAARRSSALPAKPSSPPATPVAEAASEYAPAPRAATRPEADRALTMARLLLDVEFVREHAGGRIDADRQELLASKERQAAERGVLLADALRASPGAWGDVVDFLNCFESVDVAVRVARMLQGALDETTERSLVAVLRRPSGSAARRVALALVGRRESAEVLPAVIAALDDPNPRLRSEALDILAERRARSESSTAAATIDSALRRQAESDPDLNLQSRAHGLLGDSVPSSTPPPPRRSSRPPLSSSGFASKPGTP